MTTPETYGVKIGTKLVDDNGDPISTTNPLPVILYDGSGNAIKFVQVEENRLGSECSGASGATNRVLTLTNTSTSGNPVSIWVEEQLISQSDISISHLSASSTVTFSGIGIYDADSILVKYYV